MILVKLFFRLPTVFQWILNPFLREDQSMVHRYKPYVPGKSGNFPSAHSHEWVGQQTLFPACADNFRRAGQSLSPE
ncbi:MAG: hypothetical protein A2402_00115 [Candidatus Staskawiczbacteria bacterium RIFOXYC1_FULL_37_43]|nr:MAG: hypothetical protein A2205_03170 [Candidatus Staskawiczbacteria bacterium RIFOXYA1_FULL_37_15]OGZ76936.1 MAG: hypothetical protein A2280_01300 [Candidatus Staskawiczbacteria bacterium RIFOXYA12_FULL_37_10]OGZ80003.1 MAG: hypothetical protein A2353_01905 [Candidatus Staskawiczbacteria bacterium RIFOXYB1_FULL_38_37]OGZ81643.1 MAG: hypothetical protein A2402_00115 [Candidatus Staskawiczbacteria bacterium RIFOXYC1_FULL_37_43]OGZ85616.1 MAG: hypothetical protein A2490_02835 [Candidatus Stask